MFLYASPRHSARRLGFMRFALSIETLPSSVPGISNDRIGVTTTTSDPTAFFLPPPTDGRNR